MKSNSPRILVLDIETAPMLGHFWQLFDQNIGLNQIAKDWHLLSFAAKWLGEANSKLVYMDQRKARKIEDDKPLVAKLWKLLDEADFVVAQNGKKFDTKKINARILFHGMQPPSTYRVLDTLLIAKRCFAFTSNKLEYMTDKFNLKYKKLLHKKFPGFELWKECIAGNQAAWAEMEKYNKHDVLSTEELYLKLQPWDSTSFAIFNSETRCKCGSKKFIKQGFAYTSTQKYQRYRCSACGYEWRDKKTSGNAPVTGVTR